MRNAGGADRRISSEANRTVTPAEERATGLAASLCWGAITLLASAPLVSCEIVSGLNRLVIVEETSGAAGQGAVSGSAGATFASGGESGRTGTGGTAGSTEGGQSQGGNASGADGRGAISGGAGRGGSAVVGGESGQNGAGRVDGGAWAGGGVVAGGGESGQSWAPGANAGRSGAAGDPNGDLSGQGPGTTEPGGFPAGGVDSGGAGAGGTSLAGAGTGGSGESPGGGGADSSGAGGGGTSLGGGSGVGGEGGPCETCGGDDCVDLDTSLDHCGACGRDCSTSGVATPACATGVCASTCRAGYANCNQPDGSLPDDGCETNTESVYDCGGCGRACSRTGGVDEPRCGGGVCTSTCFAGYLNLDRPDAPAADDGCEVDTATNVDHCGAEGRACASTQVLERRCEAGVCTSTCAGEHGNITRPAAPAADDGCESPCPGTGGPTMVRLPQGYCIDSTEVTQGQYQAWLDESPTVAGQPSFCTWNTSYEPTCDWAPETKADYPVVCVDWCDAYAYCAGVGKRLCGKIGGGPNGFGDATQSQWYQACVSGTTENLYPYGDTYEADTCNGYDHGVGETMPVGSLSECRSSVAGYTGVYDLSGNVWEWEDACSGQSGASSYCPYHGGSFSSSSMECDSGLIQPHYRDGASDDTGFRCCAL